MVKSQQKIKTSIRTLTAEIICIELENRGVPKSCIVTTFKGWRSYMIWMDFPSFLRTQNHLDQLRRVWSFIDTDFNLLLDYSDDLLIYPWWYGIFCLTQGMCLTVGMTMSSKWCFHVHSDPMLLLLLAPWWEIAHVCVLLAIKNLMDWCSFSSSVPWWTFQRVQSLEGALVGVGVKVKDQMECGGGFDILQAEWSIWDAQGLQLSCT